MTVQDDDVVDAVAAQCGAAALGIYNMLERRVNKEGVWTSTYQTLASFFNQSRRHIIAAATTLEAHGFIERTEQLGPNGMSTGVRFFLPKHMRTYRGEATSEPTGEVRGEVSRVLNKELSSQEVITSKTTPNGVETPKKKRTPSGPAQEIVAEFCRVAGIDKPAVYGKAVGQAQSLANAGVTVEDIESLYEFASWGDGADLTKMLSGVDRWRGRKIAAKPVVKSTSRWSREEELAARSGYALLNMGGDE